MRLIAFVEHLIVIVMLENIHSSHHIGLIRLRDVKRIGKESVVEVYFKSLWEKKDGDKQGEMD